MKKWMILLLITAAVLGVYLVVGTKDAVLEVEAVRITPERVEQTVACTGVVEAAESDPVVFPFPCVIERVAVKAGQRVKNGDILLTLDKEATRELVSTEALVMLAASEDEVVATGDGVVVSVDAVEGQTISEGTPCVVLVRDSRLQVRIAIPEKHLPTLSQGMGVRISGSGFDKTAYAGVLEEIAATAQTEMSGSTVVQGVVALDNPDDSLRVGLNARATVVTSVTDEALVIPYDAVLTDDEGKYVYLVQDGCAKRVNITNAEEVGKGLLIDDEIFRDAVVVTQPEKITYDNQPIREVMT